MITPASTHPPLAPEPPTGPPTLGRAHARRLRDIYRSAGWPCHDALELELLAAGMLQWLRTPDGHEQLRLTQAGTLLVTAQMASNRASLSQHEALVRRVALEMARAGRITWCGLSLRAQVPCDDGAAAQWCMARPDVFSIRNTSVAEYVEPVVHEIKVRRADLLGDLKRPLKRAAYQDLGECWYVLGQDARGRPIAEPDEVPAECGVLMAEGGAEHPRLRAARAAPRRSRKALPFDVWMALAKATPAAAAEDDAQGLLSEQAD